MAKRPKVDMLIMRFIKNITFLTLSSHNIMSYWITQDRWRPHDIN